jgi:hypothetical protein
MSTPNLPLFVFSGGLCYSPLEMKKGLILLGFLCFQVNTYPQIVKMFGGLNLTKYGSSSGSESTSFSQKSGFSGGIAFAFPVSKGLSIETDLLFSRKGSGITLPYSTTQQIAGIYRYSAIGLPLMIKVDFFPGATPYFLLGPEIDFIFSHKLNLPDTQEVFDLKETTNHIGFGINSGIGFEFAIHPFALFFEFRYTIGLSNLLSANADMEKIKNTSLLLLIGGRFNLR